MSQHPPRTDNPWLVPSERAAGLVLTVAVLAALAWANLAGGSYTAFWVRPVHWSLVPAGSLHDVRTLVGNGVMTVFFLVVGLEIGRERSSGSLRDVRDAAVPVAAAAGGMVGAAVVYLVVAAATGAPLHAWGVPMATDVAFTLGALSLMGGRVPRALRVLILTLAVADDLAAIVVLGFVSSSRVDAADLGAAALVVVATLLLRRRVRSVWWPYAVMLVLLWVFLARGGVEPAIAGALVGVLVPIGSPDPSGPRAPLGRRLEAPAVPVATYLVLPLFVLANTGVVLGSAAFVDPGSRALLWSLVAARVVGKTAGIGLAVVAAVRCGFPLPDGVHRHHVLGAAALCGIGFTVPLLFAAGAFGNEAGPLATTRIALLAGSVLAAAIGATILCTGRPRTASRRAAGRPNRGRRAAGPNR